MQNSISIKEINLINFKGLRKQTINFNHVTNIFGDNAVGKTTIFDAFIWLLFGKDSTGRKDFNVKTLDENNVVIPNIEHEVSAIVEVNGEKVSIKRIMREKWVKKRGHLETTFEGNETTYEWDNVPKQQKEFMEKISEIADELIFKLITDPLAFSLGNWGDRKLPMWRNRRNVITQLVPNPTDPEIIESITTEDNKTSIAKLISELNKGKEIDEYKKQLAAQRTKLNNEIKFIPTRIDEVSRNTPKPLDFVKLKSDKESFQKKHDEIQLQIDDKSAAFDVVLNKRRGLINEVFDLKTKIQNIEHTVKQTIESDVKTGDTELQKAQNELDLKKDELKTAENNFNSLKLDLKALQTKFDRLEIQITEKRGEWDIENAKELKLDPNALACSTCNRDFDPKDREAKIEEMTVSFKTRNANEKARLNNEGKALVEQKDATKKSMDDLNERITKAYKNTEKLTSESKDLKDKCDSLIPKELDVKEPEDPTVTLNRVLAENSEYQELKKELEIKEPESKLELKVDNDELIASRDEVKKEIDIITGQLDVENQIAASDKRVTELKESENKLAQEIANIEIDQFTIEAFIKGKIERLEFLINQKFSYVKFKLFETQINGGEVESCEALINGVPFSDANNAAKVNAGLDIINTLCEHYKVTAPVFIDNREGIVDIIESKSQIINLIVNEPDKVLRIS